MTASAVILLFMLLSGCGGGSSPEQAAGNTNRAPIAVDDVALQNGAAMNIAVLVNDRDPDGDSLSLDTVGAASNGTTSVNDNGTANGDDDYVTYTPNPGYGGNDSFTYSISDRFGLSASATVSVVATSTAPVATSDDASTAADTPVSIFVLANDSDPNGLTLNLVSVTTPANGVASINDNGTPADGGDDFVDYGPNSGFAGSDSFSYTINNGAESASASVNVIVGGSGSAGVSGDVTKGPISGAVIKLYRVDGKGLPIGSPVAQTATNTQGKWTVAVPLPREPLLVVSEGGQYVDETDSNPDISQRRVIQLNAADQLEAVMPAADDYLSLNLYTNAMLLKSRKETVDNEFSQVYAANRGLLTQATGFDPVTTAPTDPGNPNPAASVASKQYALLLGGAANALNAVIQPTSQNAVAFNVLGGFMTDMQDCRLDGINQDGPAQYLFLGTQRNMPSDINLNLEITRFRNNNFARYAGITASIDQDICSQSGAVPDTTAPVITLLGANPLTFEGGGLYTDAGFTAVDDRDGDVTASVTVTGSINATSVGSQTLTFSVTDEAGNVGTTTRTVNVVDTTPPLLTLNGTTPVTVLVNTSYVDSLGASASDAVDGDLTSAIVSVNPVDINTPGSYTITYDVTDAAGNAAAGITRTVIVLDTMNPVITLNGNSPQTHEAGTVYVDAGANAVDFVDGDLTAFIVTVNAVNSAAVGSYTVTYDVSDSDGNPAMQEVRIVNVVDSTLPAITLAGANPQMIEAPAAYTESGATASDSFDGDLTGSIVIDASAVNTAVPGSYIVAYDVMDAAGNAAPTLTRTVIVQDTTVPVITLAGASPQTVEINTAYVELGASASDTLDGDLTASVVIDTTAVDPGALGSYLVTYNVTDAAGNAANQVTRTVNVVDTTAPVITLTGANPQVIEALTTYTELGATASDNLDGDLSASVVIDASAVDTSAAGSYVVTYDVSDAAGNAAVQRSRTVNVQDTTAPAITLVGADPLTHEAATPFIDPGATASDSLDGDLTASIVTGGLVDVNLPGSYVLTYDVSDTAGNAATQVTRTVTVQDTTAPVITLVGADPLTHEAATPFSDPGATATDSLDGDLTTSIVTGGSVDVNVIGSYVLSYDVSDAAGNAGTKVTRTVEVVDTTPPIITLLGNNPETVFEGAIYTDAGATASDSLDGDLTAAIVVDNPVDTAVPGSYSVTYDVTDAAGNGAAQVSRTVNVTAVNDPPILLTPIPDQSMDEGAFFSLDLSAYFSDPEGDLLTYGIGGLPAGTGLALDANSGLLSGTIKPADAAASPMALTASASDPEPLSASDSFTLTVIPLVDVDVDIVADNYVPAPGDTINYTITVRNTSATSATNITVIDLEPAQLSFGVATPSAGAWDAGTGAWQLPLLAAGATESLVIPALVDAATTPGSFITNTAEITSQDQPDPDVTDLKSVEIVVLGPGDTYDWLGGDAGDPDSWFVANNWSPSGIPAINDVVKISAGLAVYPVLTGDVSLKKITVDAGAQLDLNGNTLSSLGDTSVDGLIIGTGTVRAQGGTVKGNFPDLEFSGAIDISATVNVAGNLALTSGTVHLSAQTINVAGNFTAAGTGVLLMHHGTDELRVMGDATFSGGDTAAQVDGNAPLRDGTIYVGGNFIQNGDARSFAAEDKLRVVFDGSGIQTVTMSNPDNSNPDPSVPAASGSRFSILEIEKNGSVDGAVVFLTDVAVLLNLNSLPGFTPVLQGTGTNRLIAGGANLQGAVFDNLPLEITDNGDVGLVTDLVFQNMQPAAVQFAIRRSTLDTPSLNVFSRLDFTTLPDTGAGGAYLEVENTELTEPLNLSLTVANSLPNHGEPWSTTIGNFVLNWGTAADDTDGDGVTDADEFSNGLDPRDSDVDNDGLSDGEELFVTATDPANADTDGDSLSDGVEFDIGSDPNTVTANVYFLDGAAGSDANGGTSWADAMQTHAGMFGGGGPLESLNGSAADPVYVLYAAGSYELLTLAGRNDIVMAGSLGPGLTRASSFITTEFDGGDADRVLDINDSTGIELRYLRLANGRLNGGPDASGAGLRVAGATGSSAALQRVEIVKNYADRNGGGFFVAAGSQLTFVDSLVARNTVRGRVGSDWGGGGGTAFGSLTLENTVIADNEQIERLDSAIGGGGLMLQPAVGELVSISESQILSNRALGAGGGVFIDRAAGEIQFKNNLVLGNVSEQDVGGGIALGETLAGVDIRIESNTIAYNQLLTRTDGGGGLDISTLSSIGEVRDNIVWHNDDASIGKAGSDNFFDHGSGVLVEFNNLQNDPTAGANSNINWLPRFELGFYMKNGSKSKDAGSTTADAAGLGDPYTTSTNGNPDSGVLDHGFHYREASDGGADDVLMTAEVASCGPDTYTVDFAPQIGTTDLGPGRIIEARLGATHTAGGTLSAPTTLLPFDILGTAMAADLGDGVYSVSVTGVSFGSGEIVELELRIDETGPGAFVLTSTDLDGLFAAAGC